MSVIIGALVASWGLNVLALPLLRKYSVLIPRLNDLKGGGVPSGGGLVTFGVIALGWVALSLNGMALVGIAALLGAFFWFDDKHHVKWLWRLGMQVGSCVLGCLLLLQFHEGLFLIPILKSFGVEHFSYSWGLVITTLDFGLALLCWVALLNFLNFIDGSDGIFASQAILIAGGIAIASVMLGQTDTLTYSSTLVAMAVLGFAIVNFPPAKVFCGNAGVMALGYMLGGLLLMACAKGMWLECGILVSYIAADNSFTLFERFRNRKPLWVGERSHPSHKFILQNNRSHLDLLLLISALGICLFGLALASTLLQDIYLRLPLVIVSLLLSYKVVFYMQKPATKDSQENDDDEEFITAKTALISVSDKSQLARIAKTLKQFNIKIIASGGTAKALDNIGIATIRVDSITDFPEIFGGRVKTLHPKIHGGILMRAQTDEAEAQQHSIEPIDIVIVDLYPFEKVAATSSEAQAVEQIDVGGPAMLRSAAKNYHRTLAVPSVAHQMILEESLIQHGGKIPLFLRKKFAKETFQRISNYDKAISAWFEKESSGSAQLADIWQVPTFSKSLRYGENPHQLAELYTLPAEQGMANSKPLSGKEASFNNYQDTQVAMAMATELGMTHPNKAAAVIVKHATPCAAAVADSCLTAWRNALSADEESAFGGICAFSTKVDEATAKDLVKMFLEVIVAPEFSPKAVKILKTKPNVRLFAQPNFKPFPLEAKRISGGWLVQQTDTAPVPDFKCVTKTKPAHQSDIHLAWLGAKYARSNAIAIAKEGVLVGISGGQTSRVESTKLAISRAGAASQGAVAASDGFFPFPDSVELLARAGIKTIIQPGGSLKDQEVIAAADKSQIAMLFSGIRHFKH